MLPTTVEANKTACHRILIGEENPLFRRGLRALLEADASLKVLAEAATADDLAAMVTQFPADLIILSDQLLRSQALSGLMNDRPTICLVSEDGITHGSCSTPVRRSSAATELVPCVLNLASHQVKKPESPSGRLPETLTEREREVVGLLSTGATVRSVAAELGLSAKTVEAHTFNLMRKLHIHDRASLVTYALAHSLTPPVKHH